MGKFMREIKNNVEIGKVQKAELKPSKVNDAEPQFCGELEKDSVKDFSNPTEVLGRSQVNKTDNLKEDLTFGMANPEVMNKSDKLFNLALSKLEAQGDPNAYEKACAVATSEDAKELFSK